MVLAIGKDARLRHELEDVRKSFFDDDKIKLDWLGDYAALGVANRNELVNALKPEVTRGLERPDPKEGSSERHSLDEKALANFPVYAIVEIKSQVAVGIALAALRRQLSQTAPDLAQWDKLGEPYRNVAIVRVSARDSGIQLNLYYAILPSALVLSLNEAALHEAVDQVLDHPPVASADAAAAAGNDGQIVFELGGDRDSAIHRILGWLLSREVLEERSGSAAIADAVLRGAPETARDPKRVSELMRAYFGTVALTPDGRAYEPGPDAPRDPLRGTPFAPIWPEVPVPGSPIDRVLSRITYLRSEQSFDQEPSGGSGPALESLHVRAVAKVRPFVESRGTP